MTKPEEGKIKTSQFQRRVFQINPEERKNVHQTSQQTFSQVSQQAKRSITGKDSPHSPKHRDVYFPLLIKIFALQEKINNLRSESHLSFPDEQTLRSPEEIRADLNHIIKEIEESQKWNEGVIRQANKALDELNVIVNNKEQKPEFHLPWWRIWLKKLFRI